MNTTKITDSAIANLKVASLPSRPTAPTAYGGKGYTSAQMKEAFDKLPLYIIGKFNALIDDLSGTEAGSFADSLETGIAEGLTLKDLFDDIADGSLASYFPVGDTTLLEKLTALAEGLAAAESFIAEYRAGATLDGDTPENREAGLPSAVIRHIRATAAGWAASDITLADGEIGLLKTDSGGYKMKIGDGTNAFSDLPFTDGEVRTVTGTSLTLRKGDDVRLGTVSSLTVALPPSPDADFCACYSFTSGTSSPLITHSAAVAFSGDSVYEGVFVPLADRHYTVLVWFDGAWQGAVRGV